MGRSSLRPWWGSEGRSRAGRLQEPCAEQGGPTLAGSSGVGMTLWWRGRCLQEAVGPPCSPSSSHGWGLSSPCLWLPGPVFQYPLPWALGISFPCLAQPCALGWPDPSS